MMVRFYYAPVKTGEDETGVPVYSDVPFVQITMDATNTVDRKARDTDIERFPEQYAYFLKSQVKAKLIENEVPLEMWAACTPADCANLRARDIRTVEQLAKVKPDLIKKMPASVAALVASAKNYLAMSGSVTKGSKRADELMAQNAALLEEVELLRAENRLLKKEKTDA